MLAVLAAPPMASGPRQLLAAVAAQGLCSGVAFGTSLRAGGACDLVRGHARAHSRCELW